MTERYVLRSGSLMLVCGSPETLLAYLRANPEAWYSATVEAA